MRNSIKTALASLPFLLGTFVAQSAWTVVDDFQDGDISDWNHSYNQATADPTDPPAISVVTDPVAGGDNLVLSVYPGTLVEEVCNSFTYKSLPTPIVDNFPNTTLSTLYFRFMRPAVTIDDVVVPGQIDTVFGLSPAAEPSAYGDYSVAGRVSVNGTMDVRDDTSYIPIAEDAQQTMVWYQVWFVIDHSNNTFKLYAQGGPEYPIQTLVYPKDGDPDADYRLKTFDDLINFYVVTSTGKSSAPAGRDPSYFDDIKVDPDGENLSGLVTDTWGPFVVYEANGVKWVDTGDWLGVIDVTKAENTGTSWVYSYSLTSWIWVTEEMLGVQGSWVYIPN